MLDCPKSSQKQALHEAWAGWLAELRPWDWFVTLTFREPTEQQKETGYTRRGIAYCEKAIRHFEAEVGLRRHDPPPWGVEGVWAREPHQSGSPHLHGLVMAGDARRMDLVDWGWEKMGITRVEPVRELGAFYYVTKYILKDQLNQGKNLWLHVGNQPLARDIPLKPQPEKLWFRKLKPLDFSQKCV